MEQSKRQKQVGQLVMEEMSDIFQREGMSMVRGGMVSISKVVVTPDLLEARVYLSLFKVDEPDALMQEITNRTPEWRNLLGRRVRHQLRRVPELKFYLDDTLDHVFKMEEIFKSLNIQPEKGEDTEQDQ
ncbi:MAG: 30S ribosome-binding factor RbfA [Chitinophagaceae bacterium]|nr:30S ribosome-binding factor RbfA [Chitinophagaceae bacterium]MCB9045725.1 30S ribosome-binding factor RbfA [Chitinophagales bacterium]